MNLSNRLYAILKTMKKETKESILEMVKFIFLSLLIVIPIRVFIAQPFVVSGESMFPTFKNGDYLIIDEISYKLKNPERGDVTVFRYPNDTKKFFIKRIIGMPNETVQIENNKITIFNSQNPNGFVLKEPYIKNIADNNLSFALKENQYFVMGDNRPNSSDSRYWGPVEKELLIGKAFVRLLPINNIDFAPGDYKQK